MHLELSQIQEHIQEINQLTSHLQQDVFDLDDYEYRQREAEHPEAAFPLDISDFVNRNYWDYTCKDCGGTTQLTTHHPYCRHCGYSKRTR